MSLSGGCQCGAVRYRLKQEPASSYICHCRMCQKAAGSYFAPLAPVPLENFVLTRGALTVFESSAGVERGFCSRCGTPLTFRNTRNPRISVMVGSLDEPALVAPSLQYGIEAVLPYVAELQTLPANTTGSGFTPERLAEIEQSNHQHPDHDTSEWLPKAGAT